MFLNYHAFRVLVTTTPRQNDTPAGLVPFQRILLVNVFTSTNCSNFSVATSKAFLAVSDFRSWQSSTVILFLKSGMLSWEKKQIHIGHPSKCIGIRVTQDLSVPTKWVIQGDFLHLHHRSSDAGWRTSTSTQWFCSKRSLQKEKRV